MFNRIEMMALKRIGKSWGENKFRWTGSRITKKGDRWESKTLLGNWKCSGGGKFILHVDMNLSDTAWQPRNGCIRND